VHQSTIAKLKGFEKINVLQIVMIFTVEIPADSIHEMNIIVRRWELLIFESVINSINDLEELLTNTTFCLCSAAFKSGQEMCRLNSIASESSLKPLNEITKSYRIIGLVHGKIKQVKSR
jgi:hypothetical protein